MKFFLSNKTSDFRGHEMCLTSLLKHLITKNGHALSSDIDSCDYILFSISNFKEFSHLVSLSKRNKGRRPIVVGGHGAFMPSALLGYADYVVVGHGFEFFRDVGNIKDISELPYVATRDKKEVIPSQFVDWSLIPLVRISKKTIRFYAVLDAPSSVRCAFQHGGSNIKKTRILKGSFN